MGMGGISGVDVAVGANVAGATGGTMAEVAAVIGWTATVGGALFSVTGDGPLVGAASGKLAGEALCGAEQPVVKMSKPPKIQAAVCALICDMCMFDKGLSVQVSG